MRTRRGHCYSPPPPPLSMCSSSSYRSCSNKPHTKRNMVANQEPNGFSRKRQKTSFQDTTVGSHETFDSLPDDLVLSILCKLSINANSPSDFVSILMTCKRLNTLGLDSMVLSKASIKTFLVKAKNWSESSHRFLVRCADAGNIEACYTLGMIQFYCLEKRESGRAMISKAAMKSHAPALYSLAIIQFNGSGGSKDNKDLRAGVALCARAAFLGHIDALRELGHCLQDGYGVKQNVIEGRRFLVQANARELASVWHNNPSITWSVIPSKSPVPGPVLGPGPFSIVPNQNPSRLSFLASCPLMSDYGCNVPPRQAHPANRFMIEWFAAGKGVGPGPGPNRRLCSHMGCGRPETRKREFRRCSVCGAANYCSRACQALDWKTRHKVECAPVERWIDDDEGDGEDGGEGNGGANGGDAEVVVVAADS